MQSSNKGLLLNQHVMPIDDLREHCDSPECWCLPTQDDEESELYVHHSMDRREAYETGDLKPS